MTMTAEVNEFGGRLSEFVKLVEGGDEVLITRESKLIAKLVPAAEAQAAQRAPLEIRSLPGHRVLTPVISQTEIAEEMFGQK